MRWLVDLTYLGLAMLTWPFWLVRMVQTGKIRTDWRGRFGICDRLPATTRKAGGAGGVGGRILLHAVSVGEVNAIRLLVDELAGSGGRGEQSLEVVIAATTDTGFARAKSLWSDRHRVVRYPLDFSFAVRQFLKAIDPDVVVMVELEIWPNFTAACEKRGVGMCVVNGRLTERSLKRYQLLRRLIRPSFRRLNFAAVQNETYAARFTALGVRNVVVSGNMKWDTAQIAESEEVDGAHELMQSLGIERSKPLIVAGSTAPGEHELLVAATPPDVQLLCAPRKPEWFDQAARALRGVDGECARRTRPDERGGHAPSRFLLDTIGELRQAYALADVVVVGRSFVDLHGSDMTEPVALGKPTIVGPEVSDFQETMDALLAGDGVVQTSREELGTVLRNLLNDGARREELARNGRAVIRSHQGATKRTAEMIRGLLTMT